MDAGVTKQPRNMACQKRQPSFFIGKYAGSIGLFEHAAKAFDIHDKLPDNAVEEKAVLFVLHEREVDYVHRI